jgi:hypothetical protein
MLERVKHGMMLGAIADQMLSVRRMVPSQAEDRQVIRFRPAARENNLVRFRA